MIGDCRHIWTLPLAKVGFRRYICARIPNHTCAAKLAATEFRDRHVTDAYDIPLAPHRLDDGRAPPPPPSSGGRGHVTSPLAAAGPRVAGADAPPVLTGRPRAHASGGMRRQGRHPD